MNLRPIGVVSCPVVEAIDTGWGGVVSTIRLLPEYVGALQGIDAFSHAVIVFLMHEASFDPGRQLARRPRDREDMPLLGCFAQRARHRPNPIGVSTVRIESVARDALTVRGLDAIDGTPVLDIKPHMAVFDVPQASVEPEWVARLMEGRVCESA